MREGNYFGACLLTTVVLLAMGPVYASPEITTGTVTITSDPTGSLSFQAFIEEDGEPLNDGVNMTAELLNATMVPVAPAVFVLTAAEDGVISTQIGPFAATIFSDANRPKFLRVNIEGELFTFPIDTVPYAFCAAFADSSGMQAGIASQAKDRSTAPLFMLSGMTELAQAMVTAPSNGYCLLIGTCEVNWIHTTGTTDSFLFGVSTSSGTMGSNQDVKVQMDATHPTSTAGVGEARAVTVHGVFNCTAGPHTFFFNGAQTSGGMAFVEDIQFSVVFIPSAIGVVQVSTFADVEPSDHAAAPVTRAEGVVR